ncbi:MAG: sialidase family protein [Steroidobacteraceae bacterium]
MIEPPIDRAAELIEVGRNVQVSVDRATWMHSEMQIAADPRDDRKLVACSIMGSSQESSILAERDILYSSDDHGLTWSPRISVTGASDPACAYTQRGTALFVATRISRARALGYAVSEIYRSTDGGARWKHVGKIHALDNPAVTAALMGGRSVVSIAGQDLTDVPKGSGSYPSLRLVAYRSYDDGARFSGPETLIDPKIADHCLALTGGAASFADGSQVFSSLVVRNPVLDSPNLPGKGNSYLEIARRAGSGITRSMLPRVYTNISSPWTTEKPKLAVDRSNGVFRNRLYAAWPDWRTGRCEILFSYSDDRGEKWSIPRVVNDDRAFGNGRPGPDDFQAMVAVNKYGVVGVGWYSRAQSTNDLSWTVRFRASLDGGMTWLPSVQVSTAANDFTVPRNWTNEFRPYVGQGLISILAGYHGYQFFTGGDYSGMAADAEGVFHLVWSDDRTGVSQMWTAEIHVFGVAHRALPQRRAETYVLPNSVQKAPVPEFLTYRSLPAPGTGRDDLPRLSDVSDVRYDMRTHTFSFEVRLKNESARPMLGPWDLYVEQAQSSHGVVRLVDSDDGAPGPGASWTFHAVNGDLLRPGQLSRPRRILVRLVHERPFRVAEFWQPAVSPPSLASIDYRIATAEGASGNPNH